jgi:branched-chain amino acid aminotransferase
MRAAEHHGRDTVVWLDALEHRWVEEAGAANVFFVYGSPRSRILTPELTGTFLPGITRDSIIRLASEAGLDVAGGRISVEEWQGDAESGGMTEAFTCGTAGSVTPLGTVRHAGGE